MYVIRLFSDSLDIKPKELLKHFLGFLGYYVEEVTENNTPTSLYADIDIYILSKKYIEHTNNIIHPEKTESIFILKDNCSIDHDFISINYSDKMKDQDFLTEFLNCFCQLSMEKNPLYSNFSNIKEKLTRVALEYTKANLFMNHIYQGYIPFENAKQHYDSFQTFLETISNEENSDDPQTEDNFLTFMNVQFKYEKIKMHDSFSMISGEHVEKLIDTIENLLKIEQHIPSRILYANLLNLNHRNFAFAANAYGDITLEKCAYANYKRGYILGRYANDINSSNEILGWALNIKNDYVEALIQLAINHINNYNNNHDFNIIISTLEKVLKILNQKFQNHLLSPNELIIFYQTVQLIIYANNNLQHDYLTAKAYEEILPFIEQEAYNTTYLHLINPESSKEITNQISTSLHKTLKSSTISWKL